MAVPGRRPVRLRRQRHHRRQRPVLVDHVQRPTTARCRRVGFTRLRRRGRRPDHRQPGRRPPRRRLGQRHDPRPARRRPHLRRRRRQRRHPHPRPDDRVRQPAARRRRSTRGRSRPDPRSASTRRSSPATTRSPRRRRSTATSWPPATTTSTARARSATRSAAPSYSRSTVYDPTGPQTAYDDIVFGDHGSIFQQVADTNEPRPRLQKIQTTTIGSRPRHRVAGAFQNGGDDTINGNVGRDVHHRRRRPRHGRRRRAGRPGLRRQHLPDCACRRAGVPDRHRLRRADRHHQRPLPDAVRRPDVQPHRPARPPAAGTGHRRQHRPAAGRRHRPQLP